MPYSKDQVKQKIQQWADTVSSGELEQMMALYIDNAVLLPTFSNTIATTNQQRHAYLTRLTGFEGLKVNIDDIVDIRLSDALYVGSGNYTFSYKANGKQVHDAARFTFVFQQDDNDLKIHTHHSSIRPMQ